MIRRLLPRSPPWCHPSMLSRSGQGQRRRRLPSSVSASCASTPWFLHWVDKTFWSRWELTGPRVERVAQAVAEEVEGENREEDGQPRGENELRVDLVPLGGVREHAAPRGTWRLDADAEE